MEFKAPFFGGANGVILITTKKGVVGKPKISFSNSTTFSKPFITPEFQNTYGRKEGEFKSWGDKLETPSNYNPLDFFQTGFNVMNSVSLSRLSYYSWGFNNLP